ncbi:MAG: hypothetical protein ABNH16_15110 [Thalassolituus sp.]|jgi:hypothetical protein
MEIDRDIVFVLISVSATLIAVWFGHYLAESNRKESALQLEEAIYREVKILSGYFRKTLPSLIDAFNRPVVKKYIKAEDVSFRYVDATYIEFLRYGGAFTEEQVKGLHNLHCVMNGIYLKGNELDQTLIVQDRGLLLNINSIASYIIHIIDFIYFVEKFTSLKSEFNFDGIEVDQRRIKHVMSDFLQDDELSSFVDKVVRATS